MLNLIVMFNGQYYYYFLFYLFYITLLSILSILIKIKYFILGLVHDSTDSYVGALYFTSFLSLSCVFLWSI